MAINVKYLGLDLRSPLIAASSPFTASVDKIVEMERHGVGAVVLKSVFEEQIIGEAEFLQRYNDYPEAADYLQGYAGSDYLKGHLDLIAEAKSKVNIPVIASINCSSAGRWVEYARAMEQAGTDALELNIFAVPTDPDVTSEEIEGRYLDIVGSVTAQVGIPVSVKLGSRFTNVVRLAREIYYRNAKGAVLFNRFFEPDIDVDTMSVTGADTLSSRGELRNSLRWVALCSSAVPAMDIAVSTGVHTGEDVVKSILAGARAVEVCTALYLDGKESVGRMNEYLSHWMSDHSFDTVEGFRGRLNYKGSGDQELYQRAQYMKFFPKG